MKHRSTNVRVDTGTVARTLPDLGVLSEEQHNELFRRRTLLGGLADHERVSNLLLAMRASEVGLSLRMLRYYHTRFRRYGLIGLAPQVRADNGKHHTLSPHMVQVIESLRLTHRDAPIRFVYELACQYACSVR